MPDPKATTPTAEKCRDHVKCQSNLRPREKDAALLIAAAAIEDGYRLEPDGTVTKPCGKCKGSGSLCLTKNCPCDGYDCDECNGAGRIPAGTGGTK